MIKAAKKPMLISGGGVRYSEAGETVKATVRFDAAGEKALLLKFARYRVLD